MSTAVEPLAPNCPECGDTTPRGVVCLACQPFPELQRCQQCERRGPRPAEIDPPAVEPITDELPEYREPNGGM